MEDLVHILAVANAAPITFDPFNMTYVKLGDVVGRTFHDGAALKK